MSRLVAFAAIQGGYNIVSKAEGDYKKALEIRIEILDPKHPTLALTYNNIALTYNSLGNKEMAVEYLQKSIEEDYGFYFGHYDTDCELLPLHGFPAYEELVKHKG